MGTSLTAFAPPFPFSYIWTYIYIYILFNSASIKQNPLEKLKEKQSTSVKKVLVV